MNPLPESAPLPFIKVCGITRAQDALLAIELGARFIGLIITPKSPRHIAPDAARILLAEVRMRAAPQFLPVGVFVDEPPEEIGSIARDLELAAVQIHGTPDEEEVARHIGVPVVRAVRVGGPNSDAAIAAAQHLGPVLLDTFVEGQHGGTGKVFDHSLAVPAIKRGPVWIAGGLNPDNIAGVRSRLEIESALPYAFDISSGLEEKPGVKSRQKIEAFFAAVGPIA